MLSRGAMSLQESIERFILSPGWGKVRRSRIGGGERSEPISRMLIMPYDTESQSRNADFISIALRAIHHLQRQSRCRPLSEANTTLLHNLRRQPRPFFIKSAAKPPPQPSGQRPVKLKNPPANGRSILRTFPFITLLHNLPPTGGYNPRDEVPSTLTPKVCLMPPPPSFLSSFTNRGLCDKIT